MIDNLTDKEILNFALENGIIDIHTIQKKIEMNERKKYLENHEFRVWQGKDGKWYTYVPDEMHEKGRRLIKKTQRIGIDDELVKYYKSVEEEPYFSGVFNEWVKSKLRYGEITKQTYDRYYSDYEKYIEKSNISKCKFRYITEDMLEDYIKCTIADNKMSSKAWANLRTLINGVFKYGKKKGYTKISITNFMGDLQISSKAFTNKRKSDKEQVFTDEEVRSIIDYIFSSKFDLHDLGILLAFQTGLRAGEISALRYSDIDTNNKVIQIEKTEIHYKDDKGHTIYEVRDFPKTEAGIRELYVNDDTLEIIKKIKAINPFCEYLFSDSSGDRICGYVFTKRLYKICDKLKINRRSIHKARKTYATKLISANLNERFIMQQMGHKDISTTRNYYLFNNMSEEEKKKQISMAVSY